ncbi:cytochrome P450 [Aspergillus steynii IBT 23096]|uniref:Cytochrome P450 n=1 Tax=Aspergillus steynii IBT 23096 TaxID=1392250 RepID=A0A2I2G086_9EURO|nr:cytochrome P450 [Aspergillus steynii IBT 23096]PLB46284.1 cytochrome P450 [Aspergillus steynii IBT 23096]
MFVFSESRVVALSLASLAVAVGFLYITTCTNLFPKTLCFAIEALLALPIYRLTFHPLANYPGPWLAAVTDLYTVYHCLAGDRHLDFLRLHEKYGPVVRFGPNRLSFCSDHAVSDIYGVRANTQKSRVYSAFKHFFAVPASLTTIDRKVHSYKRRVTSRALNTSAVRGLEELILQNVRRFFALLPSSSQNEEDQPQWSPQTVDFSKSFQYLLSDIMGDVTFSKNWNTQASSANRPLLDLMTLGTCGINLAGHVPALLKLNLDCICFPSLTRGVADFFRLSEAQSSWRLNVEPTSLPHRDLFAALLDARDPDSGRGYSQPDLVAEAGILIVAGSDTTATATTATLFYLLHNADAYARARDEVDAIFLQHSDPDAGADIEAIRMGPALDRCVFLYACINEAMRLSPPVGAVLPREVLPGGLLVRINDSEQYTVPAGTDVAVPIYALHRQEKYWSDPHVFCPERWLGTSDLQEPELKDGKRSSLSTGGVGHANRNAYMPFGAGRTSCVGQHLAYQEMGLILARLLRAYEMRLVPESRGDEGGRWKGTWERRWRREREADFQTRDVFTSTHEGPVVQIRRRQLGKKIESG